MLYGQCALRFPSVAQHLPKPLIVQTRSTSNSSAAFAVQSPAPSASPHHTWTASTNPPPPQITSSSSFFHPRAHPDACMFCMQPSHHIQECPSAQEYMRTGHALVIGDRLRLPNRQPIPNDGTRHGSKHSIDSWAATQVPVTPASAQQVAFMHNTPLHILTNHDNCILTARIEEVSESHIMQIVSNVEESGSEEEGSLDFFQVFTAKRKKHEVRCSKLPELQLSSPINPPASSILTTDPITCMAAPPTSVAPPVPPASSDLILSSDATAPAIPTMTTPPSSISTPTQTGKAPQYRYQSTAEDSQLVLEL